MGEPAGALTGIPGGASLPPPLPREGDHAPAMTLYLCESSGRRPPEDKEPQLTLMNPTGRAAGPGTADALRSFAESSYAVAANALSDADAWLGYRALAQLSGHLAVVRRAVCPAAGRRLGRGDSLAAACRAEALRAEWALRLFECWLAGDAQAVRFPADTVRALLEERLGSYRAAERVLLARLADRIPHAEHARLAQRYRALLAAAPTRPHPRSPRAGQFGRLAFRLQGAWDRVLDTMDSRPGRMPAATARSATR